MGAWLVHLFTASGAVFGLFALREVFQGNDQTALILLGLAVLVDAVDGWFARSVDVKTKTPHFDGALLDNLVDFLNYTIVPAAMILEGQYVPDALRSAGAILILMASAYQFSQTNAKTEDHFFLGFPSYWNILVFHMFIFGTGYATNIGLIVGCALLSFIPIKFIYPSRMPKLLGRKQLTTAFLGGTYGWGVAAFVALLVYPRKIELLGIYLLGYSAAYLALSFLAQRERS